MFRPSRSFTVTTAFAQGRNASSSPKDPSGPSGSSGALHRRIHTTHPIFGVGSNVVQGKQIFRVVNAFSADALSSCLATSRIDISKHLKGFGMPRGYPQSVAPGYERFFGLMIMSAFFSNVAMSVSTQALLGGFFAESTPQVWMIKDLAPSLIAAYLANRVGTYEMRPKYWLMIAAVLQQASSFADLLIPQLVSPECFLPAAIATTFVKHNAVLMHFVARASILQHFATHQNLGEIQKKFNSFGMVNFTIASALGIGFTTLCGSFTAHFAAIVVSSALSIGLTYASTSHVAFRVLTPATGQLVMQAYIGWKWMQLDAAKAICEDNSENVFYNTHPIPSPCKADSLMGINAAVPDNAYVTKRLQVNPLLSKTLASQTSTVTPLLYAPVLPFTIATVQPPNGPAFLSLFIHRDCKGEHLILAHLLAYTALKEAAPQDSTDKGWCASVESVLSSDLLFGFGQLTRTEAIHRTDLEIETVRVANSLFHGPTPRLPATPAEWLRETSILLGTMRAAGWDRTNFALDALDRRISLDDEAPAA